MDLQEQNIVPTLIYQDGNCDVEVDPYGVANGASNDSSQNGIDYSAVLENLPKENMNIDEIITQHRAILNELVGTVDFGPVNDTPQEQPEIASVKNIRIHRGNVLRDMMTVFRTLILWLIL